MKKKKVVESAPVNVLANAEKKLARFEARRASASNPDDYAKANFWVQHFKNVVEQLKVK